MTRRPSGLVIAALLAALAGCGTTVSLGSSVASNPTGDGLGLVAPTPDASQSETSGTDATQGPDVPSDSAEPSTAATSDVLPTSVGVPTLGAAKKPVQIGFIETVAGNLGAFGFTNNNDLDGQSLFQSMVSWYNARGGIAGHKITPVIATTDTASADWATNYQAACAKFTQDYHVSAVVGYSFAAIESFEQCLANKGVMHFNAGYSSGDEKFFRDYPLLVASSPTTDRRLVLQFKGAFQHSWLTTKSKLGVVTDECAQDKRAYAAAALPYLKSVGITPAATGVLGCPSGQSDASAVVAQLSGLVLQFKARGVDVVAVEGVPYLLFAEEAETQGYHPRYIVTSAGGGGIIQDQPIPPPQLKNTVGSGWWATADVGLAQQPPRNPAAKRCIQIFKDQHVTVTKAADLQTAYQICDGMFLYEAALSKVSALSGSAVAAVLKTLNFVSPINYGGATLLASRRDEPKLYRPWAWSTACSCFNYVGGPQAW